MQTFLIMQPLQLIKLDTVNLKKEERQTLKDYDMMIQNIFYITLVKMQKYTETLNEFLVLFKHKHKQHKPQFLQNI